MKKNIKDLLNAQIGEELNSSYLYLAMAAKAEDWNLKGIANWLHIQAKEELNHALGFFFFLLDRGEEPSLPAIPAQNTKAFKKVSDLFPAVVKHEQHITAKINAIYDAAKKANDSALEDFIRWYIKEQVEEEATAKEIDGRVKLIGGEGPALFLFDQELAARIYTEVIPGRTAKA